MGEPMHFLRKLRSTVRITITLALARTFGRYEVSVWDGELNYSIYRWRGRRWAVPTTPMEAKQ